MDWMGEVDSRLRLLNIDDQRSKIGMLQSCAGAEPITFWEKEVRIRWAVAGD